jgi:hypothetical protein
MTEQQFDTIKDWMLDKVPTVARRWTPLYKELRLEWNLYPKPNGIPTESEIVHTLNWMIATHIVYPDHLDVRSAGVRLAINDNSDGPTGVMEFADSVYSFDGAGE